MSSFEIHTGDKKVVYQILEDELTIGSHESNQVRVQGGDIAGCHLRLRRVDGKLLIEDMLTAIKFRVNGRLRESHELEHGDFVEIGDCILVYLEAGQPKPVFRRPKHIDKNGAGTAEPVVEDIEFADETGEKHPAKAKAKTKTSGVKVRDVPNVPVRRAPSSSVDSQATNRRSLRKPRSGVPQWILFTSLVTLTALVAFVLIRWTQQADFEKDPKDLLMLARSQNDNGDMQQALGLLGVAERSSPDAATASQIKALRERIENAIQMQADVAMLSRAERKVKPIADFEKRYLRDTPDHRPACREIVRIADDWLGNYGELCRRYEEYIGYANQVQGMRSRYAPSAFLTEPDDVNDVLFTAVRRSRFNPRHYKEAIGILDSWLTKHAEDARTPEVRELREKFVKDGRKWVASRVRLATRLANNGQLQAAVSELNFVIETGALPEWTDEVVQKLAELEAKPRK